MTTATTVRTPCRNRELTPEQCAALDQLIMGKSDRETAEAIGVHRVTVTRWRLHDQLFRAQFKRLKLEIMTRSVNQLRSLLPKALDCLAYHLNPRSDFCMKATAQVYALVKAGGLSQEYLDGPEVAADEYYEVVYDDDPKVDENDDSQEKTKVAANQQVSEPAPVVQKEPPKEIAKQLEEEAKPIQIPSPANLSAEPQPAPPVAQIEEPRKQTSEPSVRTLVPNQLGVSETCQAPRETKEPNAGATTDPPETDRQFDANNPGADRNWPRLITELKKIGERN